MLYNLENMLSTFVACGEFGTCLNITVKICMHVNDIVMWIGQQAPPEFVMNVFKFEGKK